MSMLNMMYCGQIIFLFFLECNIELIKPKIMCNRNESLCNKVVWGERKPDQVDLYTKYCNEGLRLIDFPDEFRNCCDNTCSNIKHHRRIDQLYSDIVNVLSQAAIDSGVLKHCNRRRPVLGWNKHVSEFYKEAKIKFHQWMSYGRPRSGHVYEEMKNSRSVFKSRLKWCQNHAEQLKMDALASHHSKNDFRNFWKSTNKLNAKAGRPVSVHGLSDGKSIAELFREHFTIKSSLGPSKPVLSDGSGGVELSVRFRAADVRNIIRSMSRGKSPLATTV